MSDTAPLSAQYVNKNHVLSDSSLYAVGSRIMNESQRERELCPHSSLCESRQFHSLPACSQLSSTELRKELISSWTDFIHLFTQKICSFEQHVLEQHNTNNNMQRAKSSFLKWHRLVSLVLWRRTSNKPLSTAQFVQMLLWLKTAGWHIYLSLSKRRTYQSGTLVAHNEKTAAAHPGYKAANISRII